MQKKVLLFAFAFLSLGSAYGQNKPANKDKHDDAVLKSTNSAQLYKLSADYKKNAVLKKEQALTLAKAKGWAVRQDLKNGTIIELQGVDEMGSPLYLSTFNSGAAATSGTQHLYPGGSLGLNLTGSTMIAGEWDGGAVRTSHQEFGGRVIQKDNATAISSHATHVAGTIVASGVNATAKGMSYQAKLHAYDWNNDNAEMSAEAANGLLLSNHSYGSVAGFSPNNSLNRWEWHGYHAHTEDYKFGWYDSKAQAWDEIAYNAPYYLIVKAAGNNRSTNGPADSGTYWYRDANNNWVSAVYSSKPVSRNNGYDILPTNATAKNILTVGAVHSITNGYTQPADVQISAFSSWGPTDDGRIKPDIVAKGVNVYSTNSGADNQYTYMSGTSMSSPAVTGSLLLLQQHHKNLKNGAPMRSATLKGLVIHTADEAGSTPGPDYIHGWGLLNTQRAAQVISNAGTQHLIEEAVLANGSTYTKQVTATGTEPLIATISWTDLKGPMVSPLTYDNVLNNRTIQLVNDLDIRISNGSTTWRPYVLDPANPANGATTGDNIRDNVEKIFIALPVAGTYTITVSHKKTLANSSQPFSIIVSGLGVASTPVCAIPANLTATSIGETSATLNWGAVTGSNSYDVRIRAIGSSTWSAFNRTTTSLPVSGLQAGTSYEYQVRSNCSGTSSSYSASAHFTTTTAPAPTPIQPAVTYCNSAGITATREWIARVQLAGINNTSGSDGGYGNFTNLSTDLEPGKTYTVFVTPGFAGNSLKETWRVWIDFNNNGNFNDSGELVLSKSANNKNTQSASFTVPATAKPGKTRMRVSMKFNGAPTSCETFANGEVEDYTINIASGTTNALTLEENQGLYLPTQNHINIYPNPTQSLATIIVNLGTYDGAVLLEVTDTHGKTIYNRQYAEGRSQVYEQVNLSGYPAGIYFVKATTGSTTLVRKLILTK